MTVFRSLLEAQSNFGPCALTIGNFDGCHLGHQSVFRSVANLATQRNLQPAVLTFDPHPAKIVAPDRAPKLLSSLADRCRWMAQCGIQQVFILPFTPEIASLTPQEFVARILSQALKTRAVLVGDNFRFGNRQAGDISTLATLGGQYGFDTRPLTPIAFRGITVSSTEIRRQIQTGNLARAARLLGRFYAIGGHVVPGHGIGSKQTVPTLNLSTDAEILPATGVYVTRTNHTWPSITNIGYRPTFNGDALTIETFLLTPLTVEPPAEIQIEFTHRLREERKFPSPDALKTQILTDINRAKTWHRRYTKRS